MSGLLSNVIRSQYHLEEDDKLLGRNELVKVLAFAEHDKSNKRADNLNDQ